MFLDGFAFALSSLFFTKIRQIIFNLSVREERCFVNRIFTLQRRTISTKIVHMRQKRLKKKAFVTLRCHMGGILFHRIDRFHQFAARFAIK